MKNAKLALHHSTASFLNSFFRDHQKDTTRVLDRFENQKFQCLKIKLTNDEHLIVPLKSFSATGKHQYTDFFFHETKDQSTKINFVQLLNLLVTPNQQVFLNRFHNSRENIELILSERNEELKNLEISDLNFLKSEQALYLGHPFHPHPKSKDEFSSHDLSLYSPELKGSFQLHWFFVSNEYLEVKVAPNHHFNQQNIYLHDLEDLTKKIPSGFTAMPIHPWQKQHLLKNSEIKKLIEQNKIIDAGPGKKLWSATSSLRSIYHQTSPYMMKFSLSLRLTNSTRHLLSREVLRGIQITEVFQSEHGKKFLTQFPHFQVINEPAYMAIKTDKVLDESIVVFRENIFQDSDDVILLSTLNQDSLDGQLPTLIQQLVHNYAKANSTSIDEACGQWFKVFVEKVITPFIIAQAQYGILLGAHQQNILLKLEDHLPSGAYFRDCQGTGYSHIGVTNLPKHLFESSKDNIFAGEYGNQLLGYYLIINSVFGTIAAISQNNFFPEEKLLSIFRNHLVQLAETELADKSFLTYLLNSRHLVQKGNFLCSLASVNENTTNDPLSLYTKIDNPFFQWHFKHEQTPEILTQTNNVTHPVRPAIPEGDLYHRYVPSLQTTISFRKLTENDLDLFHSWHHKPRVSIFWELAKPKDELREYIKKSLQDPHQVPLLAFANNRPVGYFEMYWVKEDRLGPYYESDNYDRGFHFLIGDDSFLGYQNTDELTKSCLHFLFLSDERTKRVMAEPRSDNQKVLKYALAATGWRKVKEFDFPHKRAVLLECDRAKFFQGLCE